MSEEKAQKGAPKWEYNLLQDRGRMHRVTLDELNKLGEQGWELVAVQPDPAVTGQVNFYFRRPKVG